MLATVHPEDAAKLHVSNGEEALAIVNAFESRLTPVQRYRVTAAIRLVIFEACVGVGLLVSIVVPHMPSRAALDPADIPRVYYTLQPTSPFGWDKIKVKCDTARTAGGDCAKLVKASSAALAFGLDAGSIQRSPFAPGHKVLTSTSEIIKYMPTPWVYALTMGAYASAPLLGVVFSINSHDPEWKAWESQYRPLLQHEAAAAYEVLVDSGCPKPQIAICDASLSSPKTIRSHRYRGKSFRGHGLDMPSECRMPCALPQNSTDWPARCFAPSCQLRSPTTHDNVSDYVVAGFSEFGFFADEDRAGEEAVYGYLLLSLAIALGFAGVGLYMILALSYEQAKAIVLVELPLVFPALKCAPSVVHMASLFITIECKEGNPLMERFNQLIPGVVGAASQGVLVVAVALPLHFVQYFLATSPREPSYYYAGNGTPTLSDAPLHISSALIWVHYLVSFLHALCYYLRLLPLGSRVGRGCYRVVIMGERAMIVISLTMLFMQLLWLLSADSFDPTYVQALLSTILGQLAFAANPLKVWTSYQKKLRNMQAQVHAHQGEIMHQVEHEAQAEAIAALRPHLEPLLLKHGLAWNDIQPAINMIDSVQKLRHAAVHPQTFLEELARAEGPVAKKLLIAKLKPDLEPAVTSCGLTWADIQPALSQMDSLEKLRSDVKDPKAFFEGLLHAEGPVAKKLLIAKLKPNLEPVVASHGLTWADLQPSLEEVESLEKLREAVTNPTSFFEALLNAEGPVAKKLIIAKLKPHLEPVVANHGLTWVDVQPAIEEADSFEKLRAAEADPTSFFEQLVRAGSPVAKKLLIAKLKQQLAIQDTALTAKTCKPQSVQPAPSSPCVMASKTPLALPSKTSARSSPETQTSKVPPDIANGEASESKVEGEGEQTEKQGEQYVATQSVQPAPSLPCAMASKTSVPVLPATQASKVSPDIATGEAGERKVEGEAEQIEKQGDQYVATGKRDLQVAEADGRKLMATGKEAMADLEKAKAVLEKFKITGKQLKRSIISAAILVILSAIFVMIGVRLWSPESGGATLHTLLTPIIALGSSSGIKNESLEGSTTADKKAK